MLNFNTYDVAKFIEIQNRYFDKKKKRTLTKLDKLEYKIWNFVVCGRWFVKDRYYITSIVNNDFKNLPKKDKIENNLRTKELFFAITDYIRIRHEWPEPEC